MENASSEPEDVERGVQAGAAAYLAKPFTIVQLWGLLAEVAHST